MVQAETKDMADQILRAATQLFAQRGYEATALQAICDQVGIKKSSLLYHFPNKAALREAVLERVLAHWNLVLPKIIMAAAADEQFDAIIREAIDFFADDPTRARLLLREILDRPEALRSELMSYVAPWIAVVAKQIRKGQDQGRIRSDVDPEAYVLLVVNSILSCFATMDSLGLLTNPTDSSARERHAAELIRMARCSLFGNKEEHGKLF